MRVKETSAEEWRRAVELTLMGAVHFAREVLPGMSERGWGRSVTITSVAAKQPIDGLLLSNSVRAGVAGLARTLANEYGPHGVTVNNVCPGYTLTDRLREPGTAQARSRGISFETVCEEWSEQVPARRLGRPEELAAVVAFPASERASYVNGVSIAVDGGWVRGLLQDARGGTEITFILGMGSG
jgi:3-oxoacyl-[acyl-carrier protein] reductase